jgi:hypothetical protein
MTALTRHRRRQVGVVGPGGSRDEFGRKTGPASLASHDRKVGLRLMGRIRALKLQGMTCKKWIRRPVLGRLGGSRGGADPSRREERRREEVTQSCRRRNPCRRQRPFHSDLHGGRRGGVGEGPFHSDLHGGRRGGVGEGCADCGSAPPLEPQA